MPPPCPPPRAGRWPRRAPILALILAAGFVTGLVAGLVTGPAPASETPPPRPQAAVARPVDPAAAAALFAMPAVAEETRAALAGVPEGDLTAAAAALDALVARHPGVGAVYANRAALAMLQGETETALALLEAAAAHGFTGLAQLAADPLFAPLAGDAAAGGAPRRGPAAGAGPGQAAAWRRSMPATPAGTPRPSGSSRASASRTRPTPGCCRRGEGSAAENILAELWRHGRAAGNHGDLYDNRDRGHSRLDPAAHPQLSFVTYSEAARAADLDYGLNEHLMFDHPTFGNSSTAITGGALWRSLPRYAMTQADGTGPLRLWQNAATNQLYVYPAHKDYGPKNGDLFPANTPYILVSRGSSGSDKPFLDAHRADPRRLPPRHQGTAGRRGPDGADGADGLPPLAAERALARGLFQRRRASGGLRGIRDQPRPHGQPRQLDQGRRHPAAGRAPGDRRGSRHRGPRLLRPGPLRAAVRHPLGDRPRLAREPLQPDDAGLGRRHRRPQRPAAQPSSGACCRATPRG